MKYDLFKRLCVCVVAIVITSAPAFSQAEHLLLFDAPAQHFTESCPLGNGRLGAMLFGGVDEERIILNESGMWSGSPQDADRPNAAAALPEIRRLLLEGKNREAEELVKNNFTCAGKGSGFANGAHIPYGTYQVLGNLHMSFVYPDSSSPVEDYRRTLDIRDAIAVVSYQKSGIHYRREAFISAADQVFALRLTADRPRAISFDARMDRPERFETVASGRDGLLMKGQLDNGVDGKGVRYAARFRVFNRNGRVSLAGNVIRVRGADQVLVLVTAATDIHTFAGRKVNEALQAASGDMRRAAARGFARLRRRHVADYHRYFDRLVLELGPTDPDSAAQPLHSRLQAMAAGKSDSGLVQLYFDFGRYLLISSSRPGGLPANLQGLWAEDLTTPWNGDWHLDINVQMNYWPAEVCNLSELHQPLFALIDSLQKPGSHTAKKYYNARGWVAHVITNPWGFTSPGEGADWGATTTGSAWLCQHLWDHYQFTRDRRFLSWAYPIIKGSAQFYLDMLISERRHGWLVTAPSNSPENAFLLADGTQGHICLGATMDMQLVRALFGACIEAARVLRVDADFADELERKRALLAPTRIGSDGRVMEWLEEYREVDPHHRHVSHLWGLYPGGEISSRGTPDLARAARKTLEARGDGGTGWCIAFKLALWARLGDGNRAYTLLRTQLGPVSAVGRIATTGGGTYPNLFDAHPPFQIDGNSGAAAGIAEMLLQSKPGEIELLPALPDVWREGSVRGLRARGGFEVDIRWSDSRLSEAVVRSVGGLQTKILIGNKSTNLRLRPGQSIRLDWDLQQ